MRMVIGFMFALIALANMTYTSDARSRHRHQIDANGNGLIKVNTAAGISIKVSPAFAPKIQAVISDLVARGIKPKTIHCHATYGHVRGSRHYSGNACDFDFYKGCMGCSEKWTRKVGDIIAAHGLRDGCSFRDCGHIDDGAQLARRSYPRGEQQLAARTKRTPRLAATVASDAWRNSY